jgi:hypothetical protein
MQVVWDSAPSRDVGGGGVHIAVTCCIGAPSCEVGDNQQGQRPLNSENEEAMALEAVSRHPMKTQQRLGACFSDLLYV